MSADLHVHTTASDGTLTPLEVVALARETGLTAISITDHDTVDGLDQVLNSNLPPGLEVIPGIELNTDWEGTEVHILGYFFEHRSPWFHELLGKLREAREQRALRMVKRLAEIGVRISYGRVLELAGGATITRPHLAQALIERGYVRTVAEAFELYLGRGKPAYVTRSGLNPVSAVEAVLRAKGVPVLAHPGLINKDSLIQRLISKGIKGIEVYYPLHTTEMVDRYRHIALQHDLVMTGGSDFHGFGSGYALLGEVTVPEATITQLRSLRG